MGYYFFIFAIFDEEPFTELALLLGCRELELQRLDPPYVVHTKHALLHLSGYP